MSGSLTKKASANKSLKPGGVYTTGAPTHHPRGSPTRDFLGFHDSFTLCSRSCCAAGHLSRHADEERSAHPQDDAPAASFLVGLVKLRGFHTWPGHRRRADHPHRGAAERLKYLKLPSVALAPCGEQSGSAAFDSLHVVGSFGAFLPAAQAPSPLTSDASAHQRIFFAFSDCFRGPHSRPYSAGMSAEGVPSVSKYLRFMLALCCALHAIKASCACRCLSMAIR